DGSIASTTDQLGSTTTYEYDVMGRLSKKNLPTGDTNPWVSMNYWFRKKSDGKWAHSTWNDRYAKEVIVDDFWRPSLQTEWDLASPTATVRQTVWRYDAEGRVVFQSYPFKGVTDFSTLLGIHTEYDALGRVTKTKQDAESGPGLGLLTTTTEYLSGFKTKVTNPRGFATTTSYQVFDTPDTSRPEIIVAPEGQTTTILRNVFGSPLSVTRSGIWNGSPLSSTRSYVYDAQQRLCKRIEPETGATIMDYDVVGNLLWSAQGSALTSNNCDRTSVATIDKTVRSYDTLSGRLLAVDVPGTTNDLGYSYFNDGALKSLISGTSRWDYTYNKLRLPVTETLTIDSLVKTLTHAYNNMAQESSLTYPSGLVVATTPNALGQATQAGTFATGVNYHAMGGMSIFNYGNGIVHRMTPNMRMLPTRSWDMNGAVAILDDTYVFDANGNVASIIDGTAGAGGNRSMTYDNADRLIQTIAPNLAWMSNTFSYDALDNIRTNTLGGRSHSYKYNVTTKRLDQLTLPNASVARNLAYDARGNVTTNGAQSYVFDKANRMQSVTGKESYQYDGHGRRVKTTRTSDGKISYSIYSLEGKLVTDEDQRSNKTIDYVYLNGSLVAKRSSAIGGTTYITSYQHTDSLGSPVAESDAAKTVTYIKRYTPYGEPSDQNYVQGPGFTGHVTDAATGLTYAQQRYYDPIIGRFLSVDPMASDMNTGWNFNRYNYAANNPYRFIDPDGRACDSPTGGGCGVPVDGGYKTTGTMAQASMSSLAALGIVLTWEVSVPILLTAGSDAAVIGPTAAVYANAEGLTVVTAIAAETTVSVASGGGMPSPASTL
ncbi:MAG: RHS repeat-associated core domain-containing protein, partial [Arenimonas sp.]